MTVIYWIHYPEHTNPLNEGYVGIAQNLERRINEHKKIAIKNPVTPKDQALVGERGHEIIIDVIFEGTAAECADEEYRLRPAKNIGWNKQYGGCYDRRTELERLERRFKRGDLAKHQYERELNLLIGKVNNPY